MRIAIPYWQGRVSPVFDVSDNLVLIDMEDGHEVGRQKLGLVSPDPFARAREVSGMGAEVLVCGAVSLALETALIGVGIEVLGFICGDLEAVVAGFLDGRLAEARYQMPGSCATWRRVGVRGDRGILKRTPSKAAKNNPGVK